MRICFIPIRQLLDNRAGDFQIKGIDNNIPFIIQLNTWFNEHNLDIPISILFINLLIKINAMVPENYKLLMIESCTLFLKNKLNSEILKSYGCKVFQYVFDTEEYYIIVSSSDDNLLQAANYILASRALLDLVEEIE